MVEAAGVELFSVLTARKLLILRMARGAKKADIEKLRSSLAQMKTKVASIKDSAEKARWQTNVDMWETVVNHMDRTQKHMESMGPRMMSYTGPGAPPPSPPAEKKPQ